MELSHKFDRLCFHCCSVIFKKKMPYVFLFHLISRHRHLKKTKFDFVIVF